MSRSSFAPRPRRSSIRCSPSGSRAIAILPMLVNQWCNVVRWEMRTRLFLRTLEFLWQEGTHCARHARRGRGRSSSDARHTATSRKHGWPCRSSRASRPSLRNSLERSALRARGDDAGQQGTPGGHVTQSRAEFRQGLRRQVPDESGSSDYVWSTSWGVSTRMIGGLVMTHGDDNVMRIPPLLAPIGARHRADLQDGRRALASHRGRQASREIVHEWSDAAPAAARPPDGPDGVKPGAKYYEWELKCIPLRLELGPRDLAKNQCVLVRRDFA